MLDMSPEYTVIPYNYLMLSKTTPSSNTLPIRIPATRDVFLWPGIGASTHDYITYAQYPHQFSWFSLLGHVAITRLSGI